MKLILLVSASLEVMASASMAHAQAVPDMPTQASAAATQTASAPAPQAAALAAPTADIVVTAQRRSERLLNVPLSVTAASGDQLTRQGITDVSQLERIAPGFSFQQSTFGTPVFSIRGVGFYSTTNSSSPTVSVYVDQVPLSFSAETRGTSFDLERVEVLKGPQGTLFGQNSTGGAINYIAAKPTDQLHAGFDLDIGNFHTINPQAFISGPITDTLSVRVAGRYEYHGPWQHGYAPNDDKLGKSADQELGVRRFFEGRLLLDWKPSDVASVEFSVSGWKDNSDTVASQFVKFTPLSPNNAFTASAYAALQTLTPLPDNARDAGFDANCNCRRNGSFLQPSVRADINLTDTLTLSSISSFQRFREDSTVDADGTAYTDIVNRKITSIDTYYQELRLSGTLGPAKLMVGGNYSHDNIAENDLQQLGSTNAGIGPRRYDSVQTPTTQKVETWAGFGSADVTLTSKLTLQGSLRYTEQKRDFAGCLADTGNGQLAAAFRGAFGANTVAGGCVTQSTLGNVLPIATSSLNENNISFRGSVNYKPTVDTLLYASISRGYKSGSYSILPAVLASQFTPAKQESVLAYETGFKASFAQRRVQLTGAAFYYDYTNKQILGRVVVQPFGPLPTLVNIPKSRVWGAELEATILPVTGLRLTGGATYVNSRIQRNPANPYDSYGNVANFVGESFPVTPRWQGTADAEYRFAVSDNLSIFVGGTVTARTKASAQIGNTTSVALGFPALTIPGYTLYDARLGIEPSGGRWRAQIWGHNITNKFYLVQSARQTDVVLRTAGMPATYGVTLSYRY